MDQYAPEGFFLCFVSFVCNGYCLQVLALEVPHLLTEWRVQADSFGLALAAAVAGMGVMRIVRHRTAILVVIEHGLSNGRVESTNTKIRLITRIAFGFYSPRSSPSPCSVSATINQCSPGGISPRMSQASRICTR